MLTNFRKEMQMPDEKLPVIQRGPHDCLFNLTTALDCLSNLCLSESCADADEQLNLVKRSELAGLFAVLKDYAEAIRLVLPEDVAHAGKGSAVRIYARA